MHLFTVLPLLLGIGTAQVDLDMFSMQTKTVCPSESFSFRRNNLGDDFYFKSNVPGSSEIQVANKTHIFHPSYQLKNHEIYIPEVMKKHEGEYFWKRGYLIGTKLYMIRLIIRDCSVHKELEYGDTLRLRVPKEASMLEFTPPKSADSWVLWSHVNQYSQTAARGTVSHDLWEALKVSYTDAGCYAFLRESGSKISSTTLIVREKDMYLNEGKAFARFPVHISEAVLKFTDSSEVKHVLFQNGMETEESLRIFGNRMVPSEEEGELILTIVDLQPGDAGRYEVYDKNKKVAAVLWISVPSGYQSSRDLVAPISVGVTIIALVVCCCCCVRRWCCKKDDAPAASAGLQQPVYIHDPVSVSGPAYPRQPQPVAYRQVEDSSNPAESAAPQPGLTPLPSNQHWDSDPPTYSAVSGPEPYHPFISSVPSEVNPSLSFLGPTSDEGGGGGGGDAPTVPIAPLDPEPQYQPRGWGGGLSDFLTSSPLGTDTTTTCSVYNSDKLNF